jgi:predicted aconitase with swiveling domain
MSEAPEEDSPPGSAQSHASPSGSDREAGQVTADEVVVEAPLSVEGDVDDQEPRLRRRKRTVDETRAGLAWALVVIFGATIASVILVVALNGDAPASEVTELLKTLVPAETALLGSAVGFYFGVRNRP